MEAESPLTNYIDDSWFFSKRFDIFNDTKEEEVKNNRYGRPIRRKPDNGVKLDNIFQNLLNFDSPRYPQPPQILVTMYGHQLAGLYEMMQRETSGKIVKRLPLGKFKIKADFGILAEVPGYGKTLTALALIAAGHPLETFNRKKKIMFAAKSLSTTNISITRNEFPNLHKSYTSVVVAPDSLIFQWAKEISSKTSLTYQVYNNDLTISAVQVLLCPASCYDTFIWKYPYVIWRRVFIDEVDTIVITRNPIKSNFLWLISGTPTGLLTKRNGFVGLIGYSIPSTNILNAFLIKSEEEFVKSSAQLPPPIVNTYMCYTPAVVKLSRDFLTEDVACMIGSNDIAGAVVALGGNVHSGENFLAFLTRKMEEEHQNLISKFNYISSLNMDAAEKKDKLLKLYEKIVESGKKLEKFNLRVKEIKSKFDKLEEQDCLICYDTVNNAVVTPCCQNIFCGGCLLTWFNQWNQNKCPMKCGDIDMKKIYALGETKVRKEPKLTKLNTLAEIVKKYKEGKFLVFSHNRESLMEISKTLEKSSIRYEISKQEINYCIDRLKSGVTQVLLLESRKQCAGLHLPIITDIILYNKVSKEIETQIIARGQRIGRVTPLRIHYLMHEGEY